MKREGKGKATRNRRYAHEPGELSLGIAASLRFTRAEQSGLADFVALGQSGLELVTIRNISAFSLK